MLKRKSTKIKIICAECHKEHLKHKSDYLRQINRGQLNFYCSNRCSSTANYRKNPKNLDKNKGNISFLKESGYCQLDEYSPFKYHASKAKARSKARGKKFNINIKYLKEIWDSQKGICPYTGIKMEISRTCQDEDIRKTPTKASLDRIDPNKGYIIGNVEFVCYCINVMKNDFTKEEMIKFINQIKSVNS